MIPVCEPTLEGNELMYVTDCIKTGWISSSGKYIVDFENAFAKFCGVKHAVACSNGTTAIHLAVEALGIKEGDEVIMPTFTMIATANAVIYAGAKPVLVDSEKETWNMDISKIEEKITPRTKAIMVMHTYGHPVDMDEINKIAKKHNLFVIEDAAESHGAEYKGKRTGGLSDVACFSFFANKIITTGEGGMVVTNDDKIAEKAKLLRNHAFGIPRFIHTELGFNYRLTNMQAAIGLAQVERADYLINKRIQNAKLYTSLLKDVPGISSQPQKEWAKNVYWMYGILVDKNKFGMSKDELMKALMEKGVETRSFFYPMHKQPVYFAKDERFPDVTGKYPVSEKLFEEGLYLPSSSSLTEEQIKKIVDTIKSLKR
ncbi:DegT/DnrJ/EryC1/StrS family aminotransferase [Candidatus Woesearchaeota archaeon]|nr:DegT/DnrJ/EryC1/StrS family aminotransferase [Candidatus Woesearchaeota archaeon]